MSPRGLFITFEGGEGSGKSTQAQLLALALRFGGGQCILTREPGGTPQSEEIRALLVTGAPDKWTAMAELLLFQAARVEHYAGLIEPSLAAGKHVICDRFVDSSRVYQGMAKNLGVEAVDRLHAETIGLLPDLTLLLDIDPEIGLARANLRGGEETRFESYAPPFHRQLRAGFLELAAKNSERFAVLDAEMDVQNLHHAIIETIIRRCGHASLKPWTIT